MRILITGNMGYLGPVVGKHLRDTFPNAKIVGFDMGYFSHCLTSPIIQPECYLDAQFFGDVRGTLPDEFLKPKVFDVAIHLAAVSNDPMGKAFAKVTSDVNWMGTIKVAKWAKEIGVSKFVFASSCSVYGCAEDGQPRSEDSVVTPLTAYSQSKVRAENELQSLASTGFQVVCLRFPTACGWSERLRLDLVLNDFVASAVAGGRIEVLSDGTPWRPLIHVKDMARAFEWASGRCDRDYLAVNVGREGINYQVRGIAKAVAEITGAKLSINSNVAPDSRSYQVDFRRYEQLAPDHLPKVSLQDAIVELRDKLAASSWLVQNFRESDFMRLRALDTLRQRGLLDEELRWTFKQRGVAPGLSVGAA